MYVIRPTVQPAKIAVVEAHHSAKRNPRMVPRRALLKLSGAPSEVGPTHGRTSLRIWLGDLHLFAVNKRIGRADDHPVRVGEAGDNLDGGAEIAAQYDGDELGAIVISDGGDLQTLRAEYKRVHRKNVRRDLGGYLQMNLGEGAGKQLSGEVINVNFHQKGAGSQINGVRGAY